MAGNPQFSIKVTNLLKQIKVTNLLKQIVNFQFMDFIGKFADLVRRLPFYIKIWLIMSKNAFQMMLTQKLVFGIFLFGKILRFALFVLFLIFIVSGAESLAGYNTTQTLFFFLTFTLIDSTAQFLYRDVYRFRNLVVTGDFDLILAKPFNSLFRVLMGGADVIDLITLPPIILAVFYLGRELSPGFPETLYYILLLVNGFLLATAFHIVVLALGIITLEIDHTIMIYRDITSMGRFPVDIYRQPLRGVLTYFIPVGIMITLPAKTLMGFVSLSGVLLSLFVGALAFFISQRFWRYALKTYTSASS